MLVTLHNVRISFPNLFEAKSVGNSGDPRFSAAFVIEPGSENAKKLQAAQKAESELKWGKKASAILDELKAKGRTAFKEAPLSKDGEVYDGFEGKWSLNASNEARPRVIDRDTSPLTPQDGRPYGGCFVDVSVEVWAQDNSWGKRVNAKLRWVQFRSDGEAFSGGTPVNDDEFRAIGESESATADDMA